MSGLASSPGERYPLLLDLTGRRVLVVGGGPVAARRARGAAEAGADVQVVAPAVCEDAAELTTTWFAGGGAVTVNLREVAEADLGEAWLVHTATGDREVDDAVTEWASARRIWCVRADDADASRAWVPAVGRWGEVTIAVNAGRDPARAARLRTEILRALRNRALAAPPQRVTRPAPSRTGTGRVALVGGGPGDVELLTLRGRRLLDEADVVIADRLGPRGVLDELRPEVLVIDVGKAPGAHPVPQHEINALLVDHALEGKRVVRLKGGDPFVFGRGSEELDACRAAGVPVEVVPGVTSAFSVPAAAGIPVTARGHARHVTVLTGHDASDLTTALLATTGGTLVVLMGVATLPRLVDGLLAAGRSPHTPVAIVESGWTPQQRTTRARLDGIVEAARLAAVGSPAVVVVGDGAALGDGTDPSDVVRPAVMASAGRS
ncbi:MAG: uroporphyrinogen-III C-methyltransferase [Actinomycetales bacterium]